MRSAAAATRRRSPRRSPIEDPVGSGAQPRLLLVGAHQRFALPGEDADIAADGNELKPRIENIAALVLARAEETRSLARLADALAGGDDRLPDFRPLPIADMPHRGGEIGGAGEKPAPTVARGGGLALPARPFARHPGR